jgi:hypothetical protein
MLTNVIYDLRIFGLFYSILCFLFSLMFSVIGVGLECVQKLEENGKLVCIEEHLDADRRRRMLRPGRAAGGSGQ